MSQPLMCHLCVSLFQTCSHSFTPTTRDSHPPVPAFVAGADVAAAPPSAVAAGASVVEADVAKASEVHVKKK